MAIGPIDYTSQFQQPNLTQSIASGYQLGAGIRQDLQQQHQAELARQQAAQYQIDVQAAMASPTPQNFSTLALKYPQQREAIKQSWDQLSEGERKEEGDVMAQSYSALLSNRPDIAKTVLQKQIDARKNAGADATQYENALAMVDSKPQEALAALGFTLSHIGDPKAFAAQYATLGKEQRDQSQAPAELLKATAEAEQKNASVIGSKLGALSQAKTLKPGQVETAFKSMAAQGLIPKDQLQGYIASIPANQEELRDYLNSFAAAGMKPEDQLKFTTPDANARLSAQTQERTANIAAQTAANRLAFDKSQAPGAGEPVASNGLSGAQFLASLPKPTADQVKALTEGRMAFPVGRAAQSPYWQRMIAAVSQYDPSFDAVNYGARAKSRNDLVAGKTGGNIKAINTAVAHMGQLDEAMTALGNGDFPTLNKALNWAGNKFGNKDVQERLAAADTAAEGVAGEMAKVFRDTGMSVHEIDAWRKKFDDSITPAAQKGTMKAAIHMLQGRMDAIQDQYKTGMGTTATPIDILTDDSKAVFARLGGDKKSAMKSPAPAPKASSIPAGWSVEVN